MFPNKAQQTHRHTAYANWHRSILAVAIGQLVFGFIIAINSSAYAGNKVRLEADKLDLPNINIKTLRDMIRRDIPPQEMTQPRDSPIPVYQHGDLLALWADAWSQYQIQFISYTIIVGLFGVVNGVFGIGGVILCGGNKTMLFAHFLMSFVVWFQAAVLCVSDIILIDRAAREVNLYKVNDVKGYELWDRAQKGANKYAAMIWLNMFSKFMLAICALISAGFVSIMWVEGVTTFHEIPDDQQAPSAVIVAPHGPPPPPPPMPPQPQQFPPPPQQYPPRTPPQQSPRRKNRGSVGSHSSADHS